MDVLDDTDRGLLFVRSSKNSSHAFLEFGPVVEVTFLVLTLAQVFAKVWLEPVLSGSPKVGTCQQCFLFGIGWVELEVDIKLIEPVIELVAISMVEVRFGNSKFFRISVMTAGLPFSFRRVDTLRGGFACSMAGASDASSGAYLEGVQCVTGR